MYIELVSDIIDEKFKLDYTAKYNSAEFYFNNEGYNND